MSKYCECSSESDDEQTLVTTRPSLPVGRGVIRRTDAKPAEESSQRQQGRYSAPPEGMPLGPYSRALRAVAAAAGERSRDACRRFPFAAQAKPPGLGPYSRAVRAAAAAAAEGSPQDALRRYPFKAEAIPCGLHDRVGQAESSAAFAMVAPKASAQAASARPHLASSPMSTAGEPRRETSRSLLRESFRKAPMKPGALPSSAMGAQECSPSKRLKTAEGSLLRHEHFQFLNRRGSPPLSASGGSGMLTSERSSRGGPDAESSSWSHDAASDPTTSRLQFDWAPSWRPIPANTSSLERRHNLDVAELRERARTFETLADDPQVFHGPGVEESTSMELLSENVGQRVSSVELPPGDHSAPNNEESGEQNVIANFEETANFLDNFLSSNRDIIVPGTQRGLRNAETTSSEAADVSWLEGVLELDERTLQATYGTDIDGIFESELSAPLGLGRRDKIDMDETSRDHGGTENVLQLRGVTQQASGTNSIAGQDKTGGPNEEISASQRLRNLSRQFRESVSEETSTKKKK